MSTAEVVYLKDYQQTPYLIEQVFLHVDIHPDRTFVQTVLHIKRRSESDGDANLVLCGEDLLLQSVCVDGKACDSNDYSVDDKLFTLFRPPESFILEMSVEIHPEKNTQLMGLYQSGSNFYTQCEPEGFRRICYFYDRPDMMTRFTTTITADRKQYPTLLSNGNLEDEKELADGRHWVKWVDPSLKSCYLFALVAGDFDVLRDQFITMSGRKVDIAFYLDKGTGDQGVHALESLKKAMAWDEQIYGREYDLDIYMVVAVSDFNFGAMENKGLNLFNSKCVLASSDVATDADHVMVEGVIAHEYFHNWSGNRVTCRDWFQITLKEGLTVFRDQSFTEHVTDRSVARINEVNILREHQFAEDAGPLSHPIRPEEYIEINNFYTMTVYNKGAEVIRMIHTILGEVAFHLAMDEYFHRYDGTAVTTEDFIAVMQEVSGVDLTQFKRWYHRNGTPVVMIESRFDASKQQYRLEMTQYCPEMGQADKKEFVIPIRLSLYSKQGERLSIESDDIKDGVFLLTEHHQECVIDGVSEDVVPSLCEHFSAPIKCEFKYELNDLLVLIEHDQDGFNRYDAMQRYMRRILLRALELDLTEIQLDESFIAVYRQCLLHSELSHYYKSRLLMLPSAQEILDRSPGADILRICMLRQQFRRQLSLACYDDWMRCYTDLAGLEQQSAYVFEVDDMGRRALQNQCLYMLLTTERLELCSLSLQQYQQADNLTVRVGALLALNGFDSPEREQGLALFYDEWKQEPLVMDKWLMLHATAPMSHTFDTVKSLLNHQIYDHHNPNKVRSLLGSFAANNLPVFHEESGATYDFLIGEVSKLDKINPQLATRVIQPMVHWRRYDVPRQERMRSSLSRLLSDKIKLSSDLFEVVHKSLGE